MAEAIDWVSALSAARRRRPGPGRRPAHAQHDRQDPGRPGRDHRPRSTTSGTPIDPAMTAPRAAAARHRPGRVRVALATRLRDRGVQVGFPDGLRPRARRRAAGEPQQPLLDRAHHARAPAGGPGRVRRGVRRGLRQHGRAGPAQPPRTPATHRPQATPTYRCRTRPRPRRPAAGCPGPRCRRRSEAAEDGDSPIGFPQRLPSDLAALADVPFERLDAGPAGRAAASGWRRRWRCGPPAGPGGLGSIRAAHGSRCGRRSPGPGVPAGSRSGWSASARSTGRGGSCCCAT